MNTTSHSTSRPRRTVAVAAATGIALALGAPLAASAHVHVDPTTASAGATQTLTFSFSHGCEGSPTTALVIDVPDGVGNATPIVQGGWTIERETGADGIPTRITYRADTPVEDHLKAAVSMEVLFDESAADSTIAFPVTQLCVTGETAWAQIAEDGQDPHHLEAPAPLVGVGDVVEDDGHAHAPAGSEHTDAADEESAEASGAAASGEEADPVARWLGAGGLVAGLAALVLVLLRGRRTS